MSDQPILEIRNLHKYFPVRAGFFKRVHAHIKAVQGINIDLLAGETLGLVGESGCGKSTLGRAILRLEEPTGGEARFRGHDILRANPRELFSLRRELQMIFQDPYSSLNPRMTVGEIVREPLTIHRIGSRQQRRDKVMHLLDLVGIRGEMVDRYPHEFSGGQRQRIGIARALALEPQMIVADEPVSALDVSVQAQVINLMVKLQRELGLTYIFVSHDLSVVEYISDRVAVMYLGRIVEQGTKNEVFSRPSMPYTRALMASSPIPDPRRRSEMLPIPGEIPSAMNPPPGCPFHPRCPYAIDECRKVLPPLEPVLPENPSHLAACIRKHEI
jgi:oligopeptide/dipeptide ABC transporter ATP-binding protein